MVASFAIGDLVQLKGSSTSPTMVVEYTYEEYNRQYATCIWWYNGAYFSKNFIIATLEKASF